MSVDNQIKKILEDAFQPSHLEIINESHLHHGHAGDDGSGETHYSVTIVSSIFEGQGRVERQRSVYDSLKSLINNPIHAISIKIYDPQEYDRK